VADEMNVDGTDEKYPIEPRPCKELVSCGVEIILDIVIGGIFRLLKSDPSPTKRLLIIVVP
jgi:hypothetical protein